MSKSSMLVSCYVIPLNGWLNVWNGWMDGMGWDGMEWRHCFDWDLKVTNVRSFIDLVGDEIEVT